jgi:hypothetical protein
MNKLIKDTKINYYTSALNDTKNNPKNMWNTINKFTNKKSKTTTITKLNISNDNVTEDPNEISHTFNTYFKTIGENLANELPDTTDAPESYCDLQLSLETGSLPLSLIVETHKLPRANSNVVKRKCECFHGKFRNFRPIIVKKAQKLCDWPKVPKFPMKTFAFPLYNI